MGKNIALVVFDMAGTTVKDQKEVETCFAEACKATNLEVSEERIRALQGYSKIEVFRMLWDEKIGKTHASYTDSVDRSYQKFTQILENHYQENTVLPTDGCLEIFDFLRENNIKIALTTGFYRKVTDIILNKLGWLSGLDEQYFNINGNAIIDFSVASDEVAFGRPKPDMIFRVMEKFEILDPQTVINIGDTPSDLASGIAAGVALSLGVCNGTHSKEQLAKNENHGLLANLLELKNYLYP